MLMGRGRDDTNVVYCCLKREVQGQPTSHEECRIIDRTFRYSSSSHKSDAEGVLVSDDQDLLVRSHDSPTASGFSDIRTRLVQRNNVWRAHHQVIAGQVRIVHVEYDVLSEQSV